MQSGLAYSVGALIRSQKEEEEEEKEEEEEEARFSRSSTQKARGTWEGAGEQETGEHAWASDRPEFKF